MKKAKKLFVALFAVIMVLSVMAVPAFAAGDGSITIVDANVGETYTIYKVFDLTYAGAGEAGTDVATDTPYGDGVAYTYSGTGAFLTALQGEGSPFTLAVTTTPGTYNVTLKAGKSAEDIVTFLTAQKANLTQTDSKPAGSATVEFTGLAYGYYYVTSTTGSVVTIDSTLKAVKIQDKNADPTVAKKVKNVTKSEATYADDTTASIGDIVEFQITIAAKKGATKYVLHDTMDAGLTLNADSITATGLTKGTHYTVDTTSTFTDGCTFEIIFDQNYLNTITTDTNIVVTYQAKLNEGAIVYGDTGTDSKNDNTTHLTFGNASTSNTATATVYTYSFDLVKTKADKTVLTGAEFKLYSAETGGTEIPVVKVTDGVYRVAVDGETGVAIEAGKVTIRGLGNGTYYLEETKAPSGYNQLDARKAVTIAGANNSATFTDEAKTIYDNGGVQVINQSGTELPSTGGIGTTIFYVVGGVLVVAAVVLLVTKKRMSGEK